MKELKEAEKTSNLTLTRGTVIFRRETDQMTEHQTNIVNIKKYASDLQTCVAVKQIEKEVETQDTCLHSLTKL